MADSVRRPDGAKAPSAVEHEKLERPEGAEDRQPLPSVPAGDPEARGGPTTPASGLAEESAPEQDAADDHEAKLEHDLNELSAKAQKADEYLELAQRTKADFENYRKRAAREASAAQERGVVKLTRELLPAVDNLDRALAAAENSNDGEDLVAGIKLVHAEVISALARVGVERFDPAGDPFDPSIHEAVAQQPVAGAESGTVVEVYQRGYRLGDTVIRPARVVVAG